MAERVDYQAVVEDMRARRDRLNQLIAGFEAFILGEVTEVEPGAPTPAAGSAPTVIHADTFYGLSIADAAKKFLKMARRAQQTVAIADAIGQGGLKRPDVNVLSSILVRAAKGREVTKVGKGMWGLAEWYPRRPAEPSEERRPKRGRVTNRRRATPESNRPKALQARQASGAFASGGRPSALILEILQAAGGKTVHVKEITKQVNSRGDDSSRATIEAQLNRWTKQGKVTKPAPGTFALATTA